MLKYTVDLISEISLSADVLSVTNELVAVQLIPQSSAQIQAKDPRTRATELVYQVTSKVSTLPKKFHIFLDILEKFSWLEDLTKSIRENFDKLKKQQEKVAGKF